MVNDTTADATPDDFELLHRHVHAAGQVLDSTLRTLHVQSEELHEATMKALRVGSMLTLRTTFSPAGMVMAAVELIAPNGQVILLASLELEMQGTSRQH